MSPLRIGVRLPLSTLFTTLDVSFAQRCTRLFRLRPEQDLFQDPVPCAIQYIFDRFFSRQMAGMSTRLRSTRTKTQALFSSFQLNCTSWLVPNVPDGSRFPIPRHLRKTMTTANYKRLVLAKTAFQDGATETRV